MDRYGSRLSYAAIAGLIAGVLLWIQPDKSLAQQTTPQQEVASTGKPLFDQYCATCHGRNGKGDGPASSVLITKPADLTQISKKNNGDYPFWRIYSVIDGRELVKGHGDRDMPIWGQAWTVGGGVTASADARGRILALTYYIESIQAK
jgi:mono/diheme cytochrome c family protein